MHSRSAFVVPAALVGGVFFLSLLVGYRAQSQTASPYRPKRPFTAHSRVLQFGSLQKPPHIHNEIYARRSDGSYVRRFQTVSPEGEVAWAVDIVDVPGRKYILLEPFTKSAITFYRSEAEMQQELRAKASCAGSNSVQQALSRAGSVWDTILGHKVVQVVERHKGGKREVADEQWVAPELDCFPLRRSVWSETGSHNETEVTKIEEIEPLDSMFEPPPGFVEASPLQVEAAYSGKYPGSSLWGQKAAEVIDARYFKARQR